jgi:NADPH:quinone reductase-like Zn-dependent oxidoreductase
MMQAIFLGPLFSITTSKKMGYVTHKPNTKDLAFVKGLIESGKLKPVIDRTYPLGETAEAIRYCEEGHARGKVVISV